MTSIHRNWATFLLPIFLIACGDGTSTNISSPDSTTSSRGPSDSIPSSNEPTVEKAISEKRSIEYAPIRGVKVETINQVNHVTWKAYKNAIQYNIYSSQIDDKKNFLLVDTVDSTTELAYPINPDEVIYVTASVYGDETPPSSLVSNITKDTVKYEDTIPKQAQDK